MRSKPLVLVVFAMGLLAATAASAQDIYKERETLMKGFGQRMGVIKGVVVDGKGTLADAATAASEIAASADKIPGVFPEGSNTGESEALPTIWQQWPEFQTDGKTMGELAATLAASAGSGDQAATLAGFAMLGKDGCGSCHETFRKKKS